MKTHTCMFHGVLVLLSVAFIPGCRNADRNGNPSSSTTSYPDQMQTRQSTPTDHSELIEQPQITKNLRLETDLRPEWMKQIYGISDEMIASAEQTLLTLGVDRRYNITRSFVGGLDKLDLEILPNASGNEPLGIQIYFEGGCKILGGSGHVLEWLEMDNRLLKTETTNGEHAE